MADRTGLLSGARTTGGADTSPELLRALSNDAVVIRLHYTINHLSRWLTPIHDPTRLTRALRRGETSVKDLLIQLRDEELRIFPKIHLISVQSTPDLDKLPPLSLTPEQIERDRDHSPLTIMAEFRRLRQSTLSLLRNLPNDAWARQGLSRREHDWSLRQLAEHLLAHDYEILREMDDALERTGAREGLAAAQRVRFADLLTLNPTESRH